MTFERLAALKSSPNLPFRLKKEQRLDHLAQTTIELSSLNHSPHKPLSRASMISSPSKLKMFPVRVYVLLTSVSLKLIKIKIKLIYATTSS